MENTYFAFISYAREDKDVANWIHAKLEKYPYPSLPGCGGLTGMLQYFFSVRPTILG